ncbi:MAG: two-component system response regulator CreB [Ideonella sp.]|nr:two-component system response regulator CreB [Ideonella sp.]
MPQVLLLEDDPAIADTVVFALKREGFEVHHCLLLRDAHQHAQHQRPDVAVLDVGLPDGNGMDLCRQWRAAADARLRALPVLMLTARAEEMDRVIALETGADDYLTKPFSPRELVARLRALLRRSSLAPAPSANGSSLFELDEDGQRIRFGGHTLALTRMEYRLLATLLSAPGRIRSREWLLDQVWGLHSEATDRTVDTHIKTLRAKLRECRPDLEPIATHRGLGYALELPPVPGG